MEDILEVTVKRDKEILANIEAVRKEDYEKIIAELEEIVQKGEL